MASVGVDIGGSKIAVGLVEKGKIITKLTKENTFFGDPDLLTKEISVLCNQLTDNSDMMIDKIGVGCPGWVIDGVVYEAINLGIKRYDLTAALSQICSIKTYCENDCRTALLGELTSGALRNSVNGAMVTFGTGIGGALLINGSLYRGSFGYAGEIGHFTVDMNGERCACGKKGCLEQYASVPSLIKLALQNGLSVSNGEEVFDAALKEIPAAVDALSKFIEYAAMGITELAMFLDLDTVVIGGGISVRWKQFVYPVQEKVSIFAPKCTVVPAMLSNDAGIIGAAQLPV